MQCPDCGSAMKDGFAYCTHCGAQLTLACHVCGTPYSPDDESCEHCQATFRPRAGSDSPAQPSSAGHGVA